MSLVLPILILIVVDVLLIREIMKTSKTIKRSEQATSKRRSISISVVFVTSFYILMNAPLVLYTVIVSNKEMSDTVEVAMSLIIFCKTVYHCSMFTLLMATNFLFRQEIKTIFVGLLGKPKDLNSTHTKT